MGGAAFSPPPFSGASFLTLLLVVLPLSSPFGSCCGFLLLLGSGASPLHLHVGVHAEAVFDLSACVVYTTQQFLSFALSFPPCMVVPAGSSTLTLPLLTQVVLVGFSLWLAGVPPQSVVGTGQLSSFENEE